MKRTGDSPLGIAVFTDWLEEGVATEESERSSRRGKAYGGNSASIGKEKVGCGNKKIKIKGEFQEE